MTYERVPQQRKPSSMESMQFPRAIAINGTLVLRGKPNREKLQAAGIGQPL